MDNQPLGNYGQLLNDIMTDDTLLKQFNADPAGTIAARRIVDPQQKAALLGAASTAAVEAEFLRENKGGGKLPQFVRNSADPQFVRGPVFVRANQLVERLADTQSQG